MTDRLYYTDCYLRNFDAEATVTSGGLRVYLNRSAFYPASGGQLSDRGRLGGSRIVDVVDEDGQVAHLVDSPVAPGPVQCEIDWDRRFAFMQQHSGQHLLSAVFHEQFGWETVAVHLGEEGATIELAVAAIPEERIRQAEKRANAVIVENRTLEITFEDAATAAGLRKASDRQGTLRIVTIDGLDRSACGGTHVRSTGEIGCLLIRKSEKIRGNTRLEFVCGALATRRARTDYDLLSSIGRLLSANLDDLPSSVAALQETAKESGKALQKARLELAGYQGRELAASSPGRYWLQALGPFDETVRAVAQAYVAGAPAVFLATSESTGAILLASSDPAVHCGNRLKELLAAHQGRGGGNAQLAQGSAPGAEALLSIVRSLGF